MAQFPTIDFRPDDLRKNGDFTAERTAEAINKLARTLREALSGGITSENLRVQDVTLTFTTDGASVGNSFPLPAVDLEDHMPGDVVSVRILKRRNLTTPTRVFATASDVDWRAVEGRKVSILYVPGLSLSTKYQITFRIEG
jgi:hypothetical protein